jgi:hypothetical protein
MISSFRSSVSAPRPAGWRCWFLVRIMPYRNMEDVIGGVVMTFANITRSAPEYKQSCR